MAISVAVDATQVARVVGIKTTYKDLRGGATVYTPQRIAVLAQGNTASTYALTKKTVTSALEAAATYGYGSPIHHTVLQLLPTNGDGVGTIPVTVYPLDDDAAGVAASGDITPSVTTAVQSTYKIVVNNIDSVQFTVPAAATVAQICTLATAAINAVVEMPVIATDNTTDVGLASKWKGLSANDIYVEVSGPTDQGVTYAITQPTGGLANPDATAINAALAQVGNVWETMLINALNYDDTTALDALFTFGEGRWGALVKKYMVSFTGCTEATVATAYAISDARKTDYVNGQFNCPGSNDLPFNVAARGVARVAQQANNNPAVDYAGLKLTGLTPGLDSQQWDNVKKQAAVLAGCSTVDVIDGVVTLSDVVTFYHPTGDPLPAYRYVVSIVKLQNVLFNLDLMVTTGGYDGAPLIPDGDSTTNPAAKKPKMLKADMAAVINALALDAILSDPAAAIATIQTGINEANPNRLDGSVTIQLSGNVNVISLDNNFGFYFGVAALAA